MAERIKTDIIPVQQRFVGNKCGLDYKAICIFAALGFFLDDDTYYTDLKVLKPAHDYEIENDQIVNARPWFEWYYDPKEKTLKMAVKEFTELFEEIIKEQVSGKKVILPLSGGLDSRTQAAALKHIGVDIEAYCYEFLNGHKETFYGKKIAQKCGFNFRSWIVPKGYLWDSIERLSEINQCYSEFTHPRQMAFIDRFSKLGDMFSLGHWGDVLFDDMGVPDDLSFDEQVNDILKKVVKKGGYELAEKLWVAWGQENDFRGYLNERVYNLMKKIETGNSANARIRAFKSLYWAPRWTSTNLSVFSSVRPVTLPYYDNRICEFVCKVPENLLAGRKIQIDYLKKRNPDLARITWQAKRPFNLYNYQLDRTPFNLMFRVADKIHRSLSQKMYIQRNWELQFVGDENDIMLRNHLFNNPNFNQFVPPELVKYFYNSFKNNDSVWYSHPVSMLLTLSLFTRKNL